MHVTFMPIGLDQVFRLREVAYSSFLAAYAGQIPDPLMLQYLDATHSAEVLSREIVQPDTYYFFVSVNGSEAGFLMLEYPRVHPLMGTDNCMFIHRIYLLPAFWNMGLGSKMMNFCEDTARGTNAGWLWLQVWQENPRALSFYYKHGFEVFSRTDFILGDVVHDDLLLRKRVNVNSGSAN
jgi:GNAT superfamily N-acetyltransferase